MISKAEYHRMNMICCSDMPTTDELNDIDNCFIVCPFCGNEVNFRDMVFTANDITSCYCASCESSRNFFDC